MLSNLRKASTNIHALSLGERKKGKARRCGREGNSLHLKQRRRRGRGPAPTFSEKFLWNFLRRPKGRNLLLKSLGFAPKREKGKKWVGNGRRLNTKLITLVQRWPTQLQAEGERRFRCETHRKMASVHVGTQWEQCAGSSTVREGGKKRPNRNSQGQGETEGDELSQSSGGRKRYKYDPMEEEIQSCFRFFPPHHLYIAKRKEKQGEVKRRLAVDDKKKKSCRGDMGMKGGGHLLQFFDLARGKGISYFMLEKSANGGREGIPIGFSRLRGILVLRLTIRDFPL